MNEPVSLAGGCLCGAIRYRIEGPVHSCGICHCRTCRRAAGAESVAWASVTRDRFRLLQGAPAAYASSPGISRGFCARCGTTLTFSPADRAEIDVTLASLDDPEAVRPASEWWLDHRLTWNPANPALEPFAESGETP